MSETPVPERSLPCFVLAAVGALLVGCASAGGPGPEAAPAGEAEGTSGSGAESAACRGDCSVRVENRLDVRVQLATDYPGHTSVLGVVGEDRIEVIELPDFRGHELELWIRDAETQEFVALKCVRQFPARQGSVVLGSGQSRGSC